MTLRAYQIPTNLDPSSLPFEFDGERSLLTDGTGYVEVDGSIAGYDEIDLRPRVSPNNVPQSVSRFQARAILRIDGTFDLVDGLVAQADLTTPQGIILYTAWHDAEEFLRHSPSILAIAAILGWTDAYLDDMFIRASVIAA